jgi:hypothetical protein
LQKPWKTSEQLPYTDFITESGGKGEWRMGPDGKWCGWVRMPAGVVEHDLLSFWHSETIGKVMVNLTEEEYLIPF